MATDNFAFPFTSADLTGAFEKTRAAFEKAFAASPVKFDEAFKNLGAYGDAPARTLQALVDASTAAGKSIEALNAEAVAFGKARIEGAVDHSKKVAGLKSLTDAVDLQTAYARGEFQAFIDYTRKIAELSQKAAKDASAPVSAEVTSLFQGLGRKAA